MSISEKYSFFFQKNKESWDLKSPIHKNSEFYHYNEFIMGRSSLYNIELKELPDVSKKEILHLQCHFGLDSISWERMGAKVTGVDFSEVAINIAIETSKICKSQVEFITSNVYDLPFYINKQYDIIYSSYGAINWLPDLDEWANLLFRYLKPNGIFYIVDFHPLLLSFDCLNKEKIQYSYFNEKPIESLRKGTYTNFDAEIEHVEYNWNHSIGELLNSLLSNGFEIEFLNEFPYLPFNCFNNLVSIDGDYWKVRGYEDQFPICFSLRAKKR